ncbi:MAG TPA: glycosyltransferase family 4 protein [Candidatus Kapabacteria bacterium]|nr:glycosyltransferase family 4 protein [Candidatus Kapabacteria bacterium]
MRIAHIVCSFPPYFGGMGNVVFQTANELMNLGHDVVVYTPQYYERKEIRSKEAEPARTHEPLLEETIDHVKRLTPQLQYGNAAYIPDLAKELDEMDIVHLHYPFFGTAHLVRRWKLRHPDRPLVVTYHMDTHAPGWKGLIFKLYARYWMPRILGTADVLIGSSLDYIKASDARGLYAQYPQKWIELPFGVDTDRFKPREKTPQLRELYGLRNDVPVLLFVGAMDQAHYFKGVPVFLDALLLLKKHGFPFQALFVGDGDLRSQFEAKAKWLGLSDTVRFTGYVSDDELPLHYNLGDLFILPSIHQGEAFGLVLLEAMASGVPVLSTDLPGIRRIADEGGKVVEPRNPAALADAILGYFNPANNQADWRRMVRTIAEEKYSWGPIASKLSHLYKELVH